MDLSVFLIFGLATWRVSSLLVNEAGPGNIFIRIRKLAGIEHDASGTPTIIPDGFFPGVLSCVWCSSIWVAFFWGLFYVWTPEAALFFGTILGFSATAIIIEKILN